MSAMTSAREHYTHIKGRATLSDVRTRLLLGDILDILAMQQEEITRLHELLRATQPPVPAGLQPAYPHRSPYPADLPWLGCGAPETA